MAEESNNGAHPAAIVRHPDHAHDGPAHMAIHNKAQERTVLHALGASATQHGSARGRAVEMGGHKIPYAAPGSLKQGLHPRSQEAAHERAQAERARAAAGRAAGSGPANRAAGQHAQERAVLNALGASAEKHGAGHTVELGGKRIPYKKPGALNAPRQRAEHQLQHGPKGGTFYVGAGGKKHYGDK